MSSQMLGFYTDEPAMHYYITGGDNPIVPWTQDMFHRFQERNGYNLRPRLPDLFFDIGPDSARIRYDFYTTLTEFYSQAYYKQIYEWCEAARRTVHRSPAVRRMAAPADPRGRKSLQALPAHACHRCRSPLPNHRHARPAG